MNSTQQTACLAKGYISGKYKWIRAKINRNIEPNSLHLWKQDPGVTQQVYQGDLVAEQQQETAGGHEQQLYIGTISIF